MQEDRSGWTKWYRRINEIQMLCENGLGSPSLFLEYIEAMNAVGNRRMPWHSLVSTFRVVKNTLKAWCVKLCNAGLLDKLVDDVAAGGRRQLANEFIYIRPGCADSRAAAERRRAEHEATKRERDAFYRRKKSEWQARKAAMIDRMVESLTLGRLKARYRAEAETVGGSLMGSILLAPQGELCFETLESAEKRREGVRELFLRGGNA